MNNQQFTRNFLLVWLGASLLGTTCVFLIDLLEIVSNLMGVLIFVSWTILGSHWLEAFPQQVKRRRTLCRVFILLTAILLMATTLLITVVNVPLLSLVAISMLIGWVGVLIALLWCIPWRELLSASPVSDLLLVWLINSFLFTWCVLVICILYLLELGRFNKTAIWINTLSLVGFMILEGRWMDGLARRIRQRHAMGRLTIFTILMTINIFLLIIVRTYKTPYQSFVSLPIIVGILIGWWLTVLALTVQVGWQEITGLPIIAKLWGKLPPFKDKFHRILRRRRPKPHHTHVQGWLRRQLAWEKDTPSIKGWFCLRNALLVWVGNSLLCLVTNLIIWLSLEMSIRPPTGSYLPIFIVWVFLASIWLDPFAKQIRQTRALSQTFKFMVIVMAVIMLVLLMALTPIFLYMYGILATMPKVLIFFSLCLLLIAPSALLGLPLTIIIILWRVPWQTIFFPSPIRRLVLTWMGGSTLCTIYLILIIYLGLPYWVGLLIFPIWLVMTSRWLDALALQVRQYHTLGQVLLVIPIIAFMGATILIVTAAQLFMVIGVPFVLSANLNVLYVSFFVSAGVYVFVGLIGGWVSAMLSLVWHAIWQALLDTPTFGHLWGTLCEFFAVIWFGVRSSFEVAQGRLSGTHHWRWLCKGVAFALVLFLVLDILGVIFTTYTANIKWEPIDANFPSLLPSVTALTAGPHQEILFADISDPNTYHKVFRSIDGGKTWYPVISEESERLKLDTLIIEPDGESFFIGTQDGKILSSNDNGQTWHSVGERVTSIPIQTLVALPGRPITLFTTTHEDVFRSDDLGKTWHPVSRGLGDLLVKALTVGPDGKRIFAGTSAGLFCLNDSNQSWQLVNGYPQSVNTLTVGPDGDSLFASTDYMGIFRSANDGRDWRPVNHGLDDWEVRALTVGPDEKSLFAGTQSKGIFRLNNDGQIWEQVNKGLTDLRIQSLIVGTDGQTLLAGTYESGVFRSDDGGQSWRPFNQGLTDLHIHVLTKGVGGENICAGGPNGIFCSDDQESWHRIGGPKAYVQLLVVGLGGHRFFAGTSYGLVRSEDGGKTWDNEEDLDNLDVREIEVDSEHGDILVGTSSGIFRSRDLGDTWQPINDGLTDLSVQALAAGPGEGEYFVVTRNGGYRFDNEKSAWDQTYSVSIMDIQALIVGPHSEKLFASIPHGIFSSSDDGQTWQLASKELEDTDVRMLAADPTGGALFADTEAGVFYSNDLGETWQTLIKGGNRNAISSDVQKSPVTLKNGSLFVVADHRVLHSNDGGWSWQSVSVNKGLTRIYVQALIMEPDRQDLFAGAENGVFYYDDDGQAWQPVNAGLANLNVKTLTVGPSGQNLFAGTLGGGVFRSNDRGRSWQPINQGLTDLDVYKLTVGPNKRSLFAQTIGGLFRLDNGGKAWYPVDKEMYSIDIHPLARTSDGKNQSFTWVWGHGVFRSDDEGHSWQSVNDGSLRLVTALTVGPDGQRLFAGTGGTIDLMTPREVISGVFRSDDGGETWQQINRGLSSLDVRGLVVDRGGGEHLCRHLRWWSIPFQG